MSLPRHWVWHPLSDAVCRCDFIRIYKAASGTWLVLGEPYDGTGFPTLNEAMKYVDDQITLDCGCTNEEILSWEIEQAREHDP